MPALRAAKAARTGGRAATTSTRSAGATATEGPPTDDEAGLVALHRVRFVPWSPTPVVAAAARPDGAVLAAARDDGEIELWDGGTWASIVVSVMGCGGWGGGEGKVAG